MTGAADMPMASDNAENAKRFVLNVLLTECIFPPPLTAMALQPLATVYADSSILIESYQTLPNPYRTETHKESDVRARRPALLQQ
ncbi:MAG: hypothetical protein HXY28_02775 [Hydrogenophilaceae bacterium]|jgi:hypothetical protein|nr:hypothetical protein [Hydrogenophilaceae bacterium]